MKYKIQKYTFNTIQNTKYTCHAIHRELQERKLWKSTKKIAGKNTKKCKKYKRENYENLQTNIHK